MQAAILPIINVDELSLENYLSIRDLAFGCCDRPPDGGFSFIVKTDYLESVAEDTESQFFVDLWEKHKKYPFVLVKCSGDEFVIQDIN